MQVTGIGWAGTRTDGYGAMVAFCTGVLGLTREHEEPDFAVLGLPSVTFAKHVEIDGQTVKVQRQT